MTDESRFIVISGCSGGGKSTLLEELARRGHHVVEEPGRRIVREELAIGGSALPWVGGGAAFLRRAVAVALADLKAARGLGGPVFFDRGLIDAASGLEHVTGEPALAAIDPQPYDSLMFLAPPWPEIYVTDPERRHGFELGLSEYERLLKVYPALGYETVVLPKTSVAQRADFVLARCGLTPR